jgi:hypothetical protein
VPRPVVIANIDGAAAAAVASEGRQRTAVWVGEPDGPAYEEFVAELGRRDGAE